MSDIEVHGPIDVVVIEFPGDRPLDAAAEELLALADSGIVRIYDLVAVRKDADGTFSGLTLDDLDLGGFVAFRGARSGLLGDDDLAAAADAMNPGTVAVLIMYENAWAVPFVGAVLEAGGLPIANVHVPAAEVMATLDTLEGGD